MTTRLEGNNSYQTIEPSNSQGNSHKSEEIDIEVRNGFIDIGIETRDAYDKSVYAYTALTREQAWEHIHNILFAMEGLK